MWARRSAAMNHQHKQVANHDGCSGRRVTNMRIINVFGSDRVTSSDSAPRAHSNLHPICFLFSSCALCIGIGVLSFISFISY